MRWRSPLPTRRSAFPAAPSRRWTVRTTRPTAPTCGQAMLFPTVPRHRLKAALTTGDAAMARRRRPHRSLEPVLPRRRRQRRPAVGGVCRRQPAHGL
jgi:hypothetical protein